MIIGNVRNRSVIGRYSPQTILGGDGECLNFLLIALLQSYDVGLGVAEHIHIGEFSVRPQLYAGVGLSAADIRRHHPNPNLLRPLLLRILGLRFHRLGLCAHHKR